MNESTDANAAERTEPVYRFNRGPEVDRLMKRLYKDYQRRVGTAYADKDARITELHQRSGI